VDAYQHDTVPSDKVFFSIFLDIIKQFNGQPLDTMLLTVGNIDGDKNKDTIFSRVYCHGDSIVVDSKWIKGSHVMWKYKYSNPYAEMNSDLLVYNKRSIWAIFAVGIVYGAPEFHARQEFDGRADQGLFNLVYDIGVSELKDAGVKIDRSGYKKYLQSFKGDLVAFGEPETREGLSIWYKPAKRMITYYHD
jgi:hypothetical protein